MTAKAHDLPEAVNACHHDGLVKKALWTRPTGNNVADELPARKGASWAHQAYGSATMNVTAQRQARLKINNGTLVATGTRSLQVFKRVWTFVSTNPGDAATGVVILAVAGLTLADLADWLSLSQKFLARAAIFVACALFIVVLVERQSRRQRSKEQDSAQAQISSTLHRIERNVAPLHENTQIAEVAADDIGEELEQLLSSASDWHFRGGSGRWQRSDVLPTLARITDRDVLYVMQVLNPRDRHLCNRYAHYRARQRVAPVRRRNEEQPQTVRDDILACIYAAAWYRQRTRINSEVYLSPIYSPLRLDIGTSGLMETVGGS